ncbi:MAG: 30S ribosomal protein S3 [Lentisphaeria bacterium]|nr:30S ribosomal protein S3 [Lentisphaerota bacterium]MBO5644949.1 30S ribosomal protein S3 [Lentisphaeria bacterium]
MGQKVNPIGLRIALTRDWDSRWFSDKKINGRTQFGEWLHEDLAIRDFIKTKFAAAAIARIRIERFANRIRVTVVSARPGLLIGKKGAELETLRADVAKLVGGKEIFVEVSEHRRAETCAQLVAENVAQQLERRIGFRRAMKRAIQGAMDNGADGIKINCAGRLGGSELAREEQYKEGRVPLHTLKANIDYGFTEANTTAGKIGVKVWVCHKDSAEEENYAVNAKKGKVQKGSARK